MADNKRVNSAGPGKAVATPKVKTVAGSGVGTSASGNDVGEMDSALSKAIGARVKITVAPHNTIYEGTLFTACPITNLIAINTPSSSAAAGSFSGGSYHVIPVSHLLNFQILSDAERSEGNTAGFEGAVPSISRLDLDALKSREEAAIRKLKEQEANRGKGVTREAQELFDFIRKRLPAYWHNKSIIVNEAVRINEPYTSEACVASKDKEKSLVQVRKVVHDFHVRKKPAIGPTPTSPEPRSPPPQQQQQQQQLPPRPVAVTPNVPRKGG